MEGSSGPFNDNLRLHYECAYSPIPIDFLHTLADARRTRASTDATSPNHSPNPASFQIPPASFTKSFNCAAILESQRKRGMSRTEHPIGRDPAGQPPFHSRARNTPVNMMKWSSHPSTDQSWPANTSFPSLKPLRIPSSINKTNKDGKKVNLIHPLKPSAPPHKPYSSSLSPTLKAQPQPFNPASVRPKPLPVETEQSEEVPEPKNQPAVTAKHKAAETALVSLRNKMSKLFAELESATSTIKKLKEEKALLSNSLVHTQKQLDGARESLAREQKPSRNLCNLERDKAIRERDNALRNAQRVQEEMDRARVSVQRIINERDDLRRGKERAFAERSAAVSKKIELQARIAALERGGRITNCPQIDALVKDRDDAKNAKDAALGELDQLRKQHAAVVLERSNLAEDAQALRRKLEEVEMELQLLKQGFGQKQPGLAIACWNEQSTTSDESFQVVTPLSPPRKRSYEIDAPFYHNPIQQESDSEQLRKKQRIVHTIIDI